MKSWRRFSASFIVLSLGSLLSCQPAPLPTRDPSRWNDFVGGFLDRYFAGQPVDGVSAGRHEFDGKLPDWSPEGLKREVASLEMEKQRVQAFPEAALSERQKFERDYLVATIEGHLFWLTSSEAPYTNPTFYSNNMDPNLYIAREYAPLETRAKAFVSYAKAVSVACPQIRANLRIPMASPLLDQGVLVFKGLASYLNKDVVDYFAALKNEELKTQVKTAAATASGSLMELVSWLESQKGTAHAPFALGAEKFRQMLWTTERIDTPLTEIEKAGKAALASDWAELEKACRMFEPSLSLRKCVAKVKSDKPVNGSVAAATKILPDLRAFIAAKDFVSIPGKEEALVHESPPYMGWTTAYIDIPGPYEKNLSSVYYIAPPDPKWSPSEQAQYVPAVASLTDVSMHEVWPGHFLQFLHANRAQSQLGQVFVSYAFAEGWAHYGEQLMIEEGYQSDRPEVRIGQLLGALKRDVRLLSAIGLHTGGMTQKQSEELFKNKALADAGEARQQSARGTFDPAYLVYTLGKLMIRKLRQDWTLNHGGEKSWKLFHDEFLSYGGPPIPLVRAAMLGKDSGSLF